MGVPPVRDSYLKGLLITIAGVAILSPDALLIKMTGHVGVMESTFVRSVFMAIAWGIAVRIRRGSWIMPFMTISRVALLAAALQAVDRLVFIAAVQTTTVANTLTIFASVPAFTALIGFLVLRERCGPAKCIAIAASLIGVGIIFSAELHPQAMFGNAMAVLAALFFAVYIVSLRFAEKDEVLESLCLSGVFAAVMTLPFADVTSIDQHSLMLIAFQGLILLPAGFGLYFSGTRYLPAAEVALIGLLEPVMGPLWAWAVIGEVPTGHAFIGGAIVVLAVLGQALHALYVRRIEASRPPAPLPAPGTTSGMAAAE